MNTGKVNIFIARAGFASLLSEELADLFGMKAHLLGEDAVFLESTAKNLPVYNKTIFARQFLPLASLLKTADLEKAAQEVLQRLSVTAQRANRQKGRWTLHAFALNDNAVNKGSGKLEKMILSLVKEKLPRLWQRYASPADIVDETPSAPDFIVQVYFQSEGTAWLSIGSFASGISPHIGGNLRMRARADAPSRSARKIEEAFRELGRMPKDGETAIDLGAAPGGWTYALARRGASVTAVDSADLSLPDTKTFRDRVYHVRENGLRFHPPAPVDWLCCDMIVVPQETLRVLKYWLDKGLMKHFIINLKLPRETPWPSIKAALDLMEAYKWPTMKARHLFHDRWEITLMGSSSAV